MAAVRSLVVLDTKADPLFDALTSAAAAVTGRPLALISLIDAARRWVESTVGARVERDAALPGVGRRR